MTKPLVRNKKTLGLNSKENTYGSLTGIIKGIIPVVPISLLLGVIYQTIILVNYGALGFFSWGQVINDTVVVALVLLGIFLGYYLFSNVLYEPNSKLFGYKVPHMFLFIGAISLLFIGIFCNWTFSETQNLIVRNYTIPGLSILFIGFLMASLIKEKQFHELVTLSMFSSPSLSIRSLMFTLIMLVWIYILICLIPGILIFSKELTTSSIGVGTLDSCKHNILYKNDQYIILGDIANGELNTCKSRNLEVIKNSDDVVFYINTKK